MQNFPVCGRVPGSGKNIHPSRFKYYFDLNANWIKTKINLDFTRHHCRQERHVFNAQNLLSSK